MRHPFTSTGVAQTKARTWSPANGSKFPGGRASGLRTLRLGSYETLAASLAKRTPVRVTHSNQGTELGPHPHEASMVVLGGMKSFSPKLLWIVGDIPAGSAVFF